MRPPERRETDEQDLFRSRLDQIIDIRYPLVTLGRTVDWGFLEQWFGEVYYDDPRRPPLPTRLMTLRTYLGRVIRDIGRKIEGNSGLEAAFANLLLLARRVREQQQRQRRPKVYSLHAPEVECIGKGKAHKPYEFGVKISVATTIGHARGGQFVTHVKALPGNSYDDHTLTTVIPDMEALIGNIIARLLRQGISRPQLAALGLPLRPEARSDAEDQARIAPLSSPSSAISKPSTAWGRNYL